MLPINSIKNHFLCWNTKIFLPSESNCSLIFIVLILNYLTIYHIVGLRQDTKRFSRYQCSDSCQKWPILKNDILSNFRGFATFFSTWGSGFWGESGGWPTIGKCSKINPFSGFSYPGNLVKWSFYEPNLTKLPFGGRVWSIPKGRTKTKKYFLRKVGKCYVEYEWLCRKTRSQR